MKAIMAIARRHGMLWTMDYGLWALRSAGEDNRANAFVGDRDQTAREPA